MVLNRGGLPREVAALYGKFKTVYVLRIPLVIEFGSDHIKKEIFIISASIYSEVLSINNRRQFGEIFSNLEFIPV